MAEMPESADEHAARWQQFLKLEAAGFTIPDGPNLFSASSQGTAAHTPASNTQNTPPTEKASSAHPSLMGLLTCTRGQAAIDSLSDSPSAGAAAGHPAAQAEHVFNMPGLHTATMVLVPLGSNARDWQSRPDWPSTLVSWALNPEDDSKPSSDLKPGEVVMVQLGVQHLACIRLLLRAGAGLSQRQYFKLCYASNMLEVSWRWP